MFLMDNGQCVESLRFLNSSLNPAKLRRHIKTKHPQIINKHSYHFIGKRNHLKENIALIKIICFPRKLKCTEASYHTAKTGEAHAVPKSLLKPYMKDVISCMVRENSKILDNVPLSKDTVSLGIKKMAKKL